MKSGKHIVILSPGFASDESDDSCIPTLQCYIKQLGESDKDLIISVIAFQYPYKKDSYKWFNATVYPLNGQNKPFPIRLLSWMKCYRLFKKLHAKQKVDLVHSFWLSECAFLGSKMAKKFQLPHINSLMGQDVLKTNRYLKWISLKNLSIVALSDFHAKEFYKTSQTQVHATIPFGINPEEFQFNKTEKTIDILGVGSLTPLKNYQSFIRIIHEVIKSKPQLNVVIVGDGEEYEKLRHLVTSLKLEKNVTLTGQRSRKEVLKLMSQSNLFLHTSKFESLGYVFVEALMCSCRLVSYPVGLAEPSEHWSVGTTEKELIDILHQKLETQKQGEVSIPLIEDTVNQYLKLYSEKMD